MSSVVGCPALVGRIVERHVGIDVVREDLCCLELPSGKLRGLIPWFHALRLAGQAGVVNHAVSYSNSHAIVAYAARAVGLSSVSFVNCRLETPQTRMGAALGADMRYCGPKQLGPLRAQATRECPDGYRLLKWGLAEPGALCYVSAMLRGLRHYDYHVVPVGAGGYVWAIARGLMSCSGDRPYRVVGVPSSGTLGANYRRVNTILPSATHIQLVVRTTQTETPFPSDPHYEWWAWTEAVRLRNLGHSVLFWCVGRPLC